MSKEQDTVREARSLSIVQLARSIKDIGFECTHCGECCRGSKDDEHIATVFPDEVRSMQNDQESWEDVARPMPFGLTQEGNETFEWALQTDSCGNCVFYDESAEDGGCARYGDRPVICETYPFGVEFDEREEDPGVVERSGNVVAHECEGLGKEIEWGDAVELAKAVKHRAITEAQEEQEVIATYRASSQSSNDTVVYDSEGVKQPDGSIVGSPED